MSQPTFQVSAEEKKNFNQGLLNFLQASPTPFHAVEEMKRALLADGFTALDESVEWSLTAGKYFVTRNDSTIVAFTLANEVIEQGLRMMGAHTDSPCLKVKPNPDILSQGYAQLGVEVYGGALLNPWFDRDLSLAGRVVYKTKAGDIKNALVDFKEAVAMIPSLAIHLDREANKDRTINAQQHLPIVLSQADTVQDFRQLLAQVLDDDDLECVLDYEILCYDTQAPALVGLKKEFIASARLDNLLSCYIGLKALLAGSNGSSLLVCNDHEEVGSMSACGAQGPFLESILLRIAGGNEAFARMMANSMMISIDNAHAIHPNYADRHDELHGPKINAGPVIKTNANQRYATNANTGALFRLWCQQEGVPVQDFVVRSDMACGSTIGPITSAELGVDTIDIGLPTFGMHSIREWAGASDGVMLNAVLSRFLSSTL